MLNIKVLGSGCPNCKVLEANAKKAIEEMKIKADIEKVTDITKIMEYEVMSTPALVVVENVVSSGRVLSSEEIKKLLR